MKSTRLLAAAVTLAAVAVPTTLTSPAVAADAPSNQRVCDLSAWRDFDSPTPAVPVAVTKAGSGVAELDVDAAAIPAGRYAGELKVRIGELSHVVTYERWNLVLKSPSGGEVVLHSGTNTDTLGTRLVMSDVEFVTDSSAPIPAEHEGPLTGASAEDPLQLQAVGSLKGLMGATAAGKWTLVIEDVNGEVKPRSGGRAGGEEVGSFDGDWTLSIKDTDCKSQPPVATATLDPRYKVAIVGQHVVLTGEASADPDKAEGEAQGLTYEWSLDGGVTWIKTSGPTYDPKFTTAGPKTVLLKVTDASGEWSIVEFTVNATAAPTPVISASTLTPAIGQGVTFSAAGSADDGTIVTYEWGIGAPDYRVPGAELTTNFQSGGVIHVYLRVTDEVGAQAETSLAVTVGGSPSGGGGGAPQQPTNPGTPQQPTNPGTPGKPAVPTSPTPGTDATQLPDEGFGGAAPPSEAFAEDGFSALLSAASKHKSKKAIKKGVAVKFTLSSPGEVTVRLMATPKDAKKAGVKLKGKKAVAIAAGRVELEEAGAAKVTLKVKKKYRSLFTKLKAKKKLKLVVRAVASSADSGSELAVAKKLTVTR